MCSTFTPDCGYDNSTFNLIRDVFCPNTKRSGELCRNKKTFEDRSDYQCPQYASVLQVRNVHFEDQTISSFLSFCKGVYIFEKSPKSIQDLIGDVCCPGKYSFNREECESLDSYETTTPRSIYGCGNRGAWLFVHKVRFTSQEHVKTIKTDKTRFFFAKKRWTWYPTNNCYFMSHSNQPNIARKNCALTTKYNSLLEMCLVQPVKVKVCLHFNQ